MILPEDEAEIFGETNGETNFIGSDSSLALDLAQLFKTVLADRLIFKFFNNGQLSEKHFAQDLNCRYLKDAGRKIVLQEWDKRLDTTIEHRRLKRSVSYERLIRLECFKIVKHLTAVEEYRGFRAWRRIFRDINSLQ